MQPGKKMSKNHCHYWKYDGGTYETRTASTVDDMLVTAGFLGGFSDQQLTDFYLDEMGHETAGEIKSFRPFGTLWC